MSKAGIAVLGLVLVGSVMAAVFIGVGGCGERGGGGDGGCLYD